MAQVICPYCFKRAARKDLTFRCPPACGREPGGLKEFTAAEMGKDDTCPHGRHPQARRLCPNCHRDLLREYVESDNQLVAIIGDHASGKSTFVGVLIHEFRGRLGERFGGAALDMLGETSRIEYERRLEVMWRDGQTPRPTQGLRSASRHEPLMFALRFPRRSRIPGVTASPRTAITVFYDTAGEDSQNSGNMDFLSGYLDASAGIIVIIDSAALIGAPPEGGRKVDRHPLAPLSVLAEHLRETSKHPGSRLKTPLAVVISKIDRIGDQFEPGSALRRDSLHDGYFDDSDSRDVHEEIRSWLDFRGLGYMDRSVSNNFAHYRYFGVSALGHSPDGGTRIAAEGVQPYRVEDPMLWLLSGFGAVARNGARR
jgi:GTPase SAR1 family protein